VHRGFEHPLRRSFPAALRHTAMRLPLAHFPERLPALVAGSMLRRTAALGIILKMLPTRRAYPAPAGQPVAAALRGPRPSPYPW